MTFVLNQRVYTPKGAANFIGYLNDSQCQVSRRVPATELSRDEAIKGKPVLAECSTEDFKSWQKSAVIVRNEIYLIEQVTATEKELVTA